MELIYDSVVSEIIERPQPENEMYVFSICWDLQYVWLDCMKEWTTQHHQLHWQTDVWVHKNVHENISPLSHRMGRGA